MKTLILFALSMLVMSCSDDDAPVILKPDTYRISILDENGKEVFEGGGSTQFSYYYTGDQHLSLYDPYSVVPIRDDYAFMGIHVRFAEYSTFKSGYLFQRFYSLEEDFGFATETGSIKILRRHSDGMSGRISMIMTADPDVPALHPHPAWGRKVRLMSLSGFQRQTKADS
jgi:hypothetical protein